MGRQERESRGGEKEEAGYQQMTFEAMEGLAPPEITLERCVVTVLPTYRKKGQGYQWECVVKELPDLFNQESEETYHLHAATYAKEAHSKRLRPGDVLQLWGVISTQELPLQSGETETLHHLTVSKIAVLKRAPRRTITIFEAERHKGL